MVFTGFQSLFDSDGVLDGRNFANNADEQHKDYQ